jgi:Kef-type K+ transport system membrane component KefB
MSPVLQLLLELSILITAAKLAGLLSTKLGQPAVLGEILAGLILGPSLLDIQHLPFFTSPNLEETITEFAEIGVIFLMFLAGLEVELDAMRRSGKVVVLAGLMGVAVPLAMGLGVALPFGYPMLEAIGIGLLLTATSVSISAQTLLELGMLRTREGIALLGAAVVDDVVVILLVSIFLAIAGSAGGGAADVGILLLRVVLFLAVFSAAGWVLIPRALELVDRLPISQGLLAFTVVLALFFAWSAEVIGGIAMITGSFMAGLFAGRSHLRHRIEGGISALTYGLFVPIFFVNIGLHANLRELSGDLIWLTVLITVVAIISKVLGSGLGARMGGFTNGESFRLGIGMISRGEVGLIVAQLLVAQQLVSTEIITVAVIMVLATTLVTPPLLRAAFARQRPAEPATTEA